MTNQPINCIKCSHYYVTWDRNFPNGCKAYGFKSAARPSVTVQKASGEACMKYSAKR